MPTPFDVIDGASVPGHPGLYVLGCYDSRITFYSQQVRALALAHALFDQGHLPINVTIAVVGGGAGGATLAAALALTGDVRVYLFERAHELLPLQSATDQRRIDPHLYDWPKDDASHEVAELPLLDWKSGSARQVRQSVLHEFAAVQAAVGNRLEVLLRHDVTSVEPVGAQYEVSFDREPNAADLAAGRARGAGRMRVDLVIFAFGFGVEPARPIPNTNTESYWSDAGVPGPDIRGMARPRFFVSGNGDGGLIDLVAAASADFSHAQTIRAIVGQPGVNELGDRLQAIDVEARAADAINAPFDFVAAYDAQIGADVDRLGLVDEMIRRLRPGVQLTFQTQDVALMSIRTATLNRLAVYLVIKACERDAVAQFRHVVCANVSATNPPAGPGQPDYLLDCAGIEVPADKVIVRRGPDRNAVRHPFAPVLAGYEAQHDVWLMRLAAESLAPALTGAARSHFVRLTAQAQIPMPRYLQQEMAALVPTRMQLQRGGGQVRWSGDVHLADAGAIWAPRIREAQMICLATPAELGLLAHAVARLVIHADRTVIFANVPAWQAFLVPLTTGSPHAEDLRMPVLRPFGGGGAILNPVVLAADAAREQLHAAMDLWILGEIDRHLLGYFADGTDSGRRVQFRAAQDLRAAMHETWLLWRESFQATPPLLNRFLRLTLCALDTDESEGEAQTLVGPLKLKSLIRATAVALAVASGWRAITPRSDRPGNLARSIGGQVRTGHACAADMILGDAMELSAAKFMWQTHFVLLPMVRRPSEFAVLADAPLVQTRESELRLIDVENRTNIVITIDESFVTAVGVGLEALVALLGQAEDFHFRHLNRAIERAGVQ